MDYLEKRIQELESEHEAHLLRASQPWGWRGLIREMLGRRLGRVTRLILLVQIALLAISVWAAIQFFTTSDVLGAVKYGITWAVLLIVANIYLVGMMPHLHTERVLRALKRVEILILAKKSDTD
ncbi:DUF6768 family protein [Shimia sp.]|uniref:DUF6768 family protein n=1 Tax=Shimia sp. TaxID=1954381 RepID=UPI003564CF62